MGGVYKKIWSNWSVARCLETLHPKNVVKTDTAPLILIPNRRLIPLPDYHFGVATHWEVGQQEIELWAGSQMLTYCWLVSNPWITENDGQKKCSGNDAQIIVSSSQYLELHPSNIVTSKWPKTLRVTNPINHCTIAYKYPSPPQLNGY